MKILLIYQYYHNPDCGATCRHYSFLKHLAASHEVTVLTTDAWRNRRKSNDFPWAPEGVQIVSIDVPYSNVMGTRSRMTAFFRFAFSAVARGRRLPKPDVVWGSSTPLTAAWAAHHIARSHRVPWVFEVRDLWPDFPIQMGAIRSRFLQNRLYGLEQRLYSSASKIVTLSEDMFTHVNATGTPAEKLVTIPNGTDFDLLNRIDEATAQRLRAKHDLSDKTVVLYAGTFGRANDIPGILETARRLATHEELRFVLLGAGYLEEDVREAAAALPNLIFVGEKNRQETLSWFRTADVSLITFRDLPVLAANSPAKLFDSLGAGTPVVVTNPGWTRRLVETHSCGWFVGAEDPGALAALLSKLIKSPDEIESAGRNGARLAAERFDRRVLSEQMESVLLEAAGTS